MHPIFLVISPEINGCSRVPPKRQAVTMLWPVGPVQYTAVFCNGGTLRSETVIAFMVMSVQSASRIP